MVRLVGRAFVDQLRVRVPEAHVDEQLGLEMQEFLRDSLARMHDFVQSVILTEQGQKVEQVIEPLMHNLTGRMLDRFRQDGTTTVGTRLSATRDEATIELKTRGMMTILSMRMIRVPSQPK